MIRIPGYHIVRLLGKGGMAEVYLAVQQSFEREVALKIMSQATVEDEAYSERFLREARIVSRLMHPNIVTVYDVGIIDGHHFLSMEFIPGQDLKKARHRLALAQRVDVVKDIAKALEYAGRKGYVHRDVKPENIMLHAEDGHAVLMDFGIARPSGLRGGVTESGTAIGTPHYMSPEQARGKEVDLRSDIYSLGVVLYLMLTGSVPFDADSAVAVGLKHVSEPIPRLPSQLQLFQRIIDRSMAKSPINRYQNAAELLADLEQIPRYGIESIERHVRDANVNGSPQESVAVTASKIQSGPNELTPPEQRLTADVSSEFEQVEPVAERRGGSRWPWLVGLVIALGTGYGVYRHQQMPAEQRVDAVKSVFSDATSMLDGSRNRARLPAAGEIPVAQVRSMPEPVAAEVEGDGRAVDFSQPGTTIEPEAVAAQASGLAPQDPPAAPGLDSTVQSPDADREQLLTRAQYLLQNLEADQGGVVEIANIYRGLIERNPIDIEAGQGLQALRALMIDRIEAAMVRRDFDFAREQLDLAGRAFKAEAFVTKMNAMLQRIGDQDQVATRLAAARKYLQENALTQPEDANALQSLRQVLELDPANAEALAGLDEIARRHQLIAMQQMDEGNNNAAMAALNQGLLAQPEYAGLLSIKAELERAATLDQLVQKARRQWGMGHILQPFGDSSLETWRQVLDLDPQHSEAQQQLRLIAGNLVSGVESSIQAGAWNEARAKIARALAYFPENIELQELKQINERAMVETVKPKISRLLVSDSALKGVSGTQAEQLKTGPILYVGFQFEKFEVPTKLVVRMFTGEPEIETDRHELTLSKEGGLSYFSLEKSARGFPAGRYRLELVLNGVTLAGTSFQIESHDAAAAGRGESPVPTVSP